MHVQGKCADKSHYNDLPLIAFLQDTSLYFHILIFINLACEYFWAEIYKCHLDKEYEEARPEIACQFFKFHLHRLIIFFWIRKDFFYLCFIINEKISIFLFTIIWIIIIVIDVANNCNSIEVFIEFHLSSGRSIAHLFFLYWIYWHI